MNLTFFAGRRSPDSRSFRKMASAAVIVGKVTSALCDTGYSAAAIAKTGSLKLEIVKRNEPHRFVVLPKRWIVERTLAWISHNCRLARDFERSARSAAAIVRLAMIRMMLKRLTKPAHCS
jgi:transposase